MSLLLAAAAFPRLEVLASNPSFFGPGDPAIYFQMGRGVLEEGVPRVDFLHHFLTRPDSIQHVEDYYEPVFGYLVAAVMLARGETPAAAATLPFLAGLAAIVIAWSLARRFGSKVALTAAAMVAFEPWSILYSGVLMKETVVAVVALAFVELVRRAVARDLSGRRLGLVLGIATVVAGLFQYELLPILGAATVAVLVLHRRSALGWYVAATTAGVGLLAAVTWLTVGVPITAKYAFFLGRAPGDPDALRTMTAGPSAWSLAVAGEYLGRSTLILWYPLLLVLAGIGAWSSAIRPEHRTIYASLAASLLLMHAVARDLWARDFIPLTAVLSIPAAIAIHDTWIWRTRWGVPILAATLVFLFAAPPLLGFVAPHSELIPRGLWPRVAIGLALAGVAFAGLRTLGGRGWPGWIVRATPAVIALGLAWGFWTQLPYSRLAMNPQFPDYEIERARRERVCAWVRATVAPAPIIARIPAEVSYYTGFPSIVMPESLRTGTMERLAARYDVRYLLVEPGALPESALSAMPLIPLGQSEGCRLFEFGNARPSGSLRGPRPAESGPNSTLKSR